VLVGPGSVEAVEASNGKAIQLSNAADTVSISIHVYGGDIGRITRYPLEADGAALALAAGYANTDESPAYDISSIQSEIRD
jgi:predicted metal-dependent enzyme (double-stranded beta helix superfamily)